MRAPTHPALDLFYYSSRSGNTARFVANLGRPAQQIPIDGALPKARLPFVLICPTYADGEGKGSVPSQVIRFLNDPETREQLRGVIGTGNRNFGATYALSGRVIAQKCGVPLLYTFELAGTPTDIDRVRAGLEKLETDICSIRS